MKSRHSRVKVCQWSEKPNKVGIEYALDNIAYKGRFAIGEEITELSISLYKGKLEFIHIRCSKPQYEWDRGYNSFLVHSSMRSQRKSMYTPYDEQKQIQHEELLKFLIGAKKFFEENKLNVKILDDDYNETTIEEIISSFVETNSINFRYDSMNFNELKETVEKQYKNEEIIDDDGQPLTVKDWKETNTNITKKLRANNVKCKSAFYNPNDDRIYIKQTFRNIKIDGLTQITNTCEDVVCWICDGKEEYINGYWDDEYISVESTPLL